MWIWSSCTPNGGNVVILGRRYKCTNTQSCAVTRMTMNWMKCTIETMLQQWLYELLWQHHCDLRWSVINFFSWIPFHREFVCTSTESSSTGVTITAVLDISQSVLIFSSVNDLLFFIQQYILESNKNTTEALHTTERLSFPRSMWIAVRLITCYFTI